MTHVRFNSRPSLIDSIFSDLPVFFNEGVNRFSAPVNIRESADAYQLELVAPGYEKTDFKVNLEGNLLTISVEKAQENKEEKLLRREYSFRNFKRSFTIDDEIDATNIQANYVNGILVLNLPKKKEVKEASKAIVIN